MKLYVKRDIEWLYPDEDEIGTKEYKQEVIVLHTAKGSPTGFQLLVTDVEKSISVTDCGLGPKAEINILQEVLVNFNTAEVESGFGNKAFVYLEKQKSCPKQCTRIAPFWVYDAYKPYEGEKVILDRQAFYICFPVTMETEAGVYRKELEIRSGADVKQVIVELHVYDAGLPEENHFQVTNWFSIDNMASFHEMPKYSEAHFQMIDAYAKAMRRMRQTQFMLTPNQVEVQEKAGIYQFDFTMFEKIAKIFFENGFQKLEFGTLGTRKRVTNEELYVLNLEEVPVESEKGKEVLHSFFQGLYKVAEKNDWLDKIIFHIADEPDEPYSAIERRMSQYAFIHRVMREYFKDAAVCEAVKTSHFKKYIDILVPLSKTYEEAEEEFRDSGREIWVYTCCVPTGDYYQRFLDVPLVANRILFWTLAKHGITGYLHWGLNQMEPDQHPFTQTNQYHTYGDGVCLPAGDSHILYPDKEKLYYSMRLEACRKGSEDVELLTQLKEKNKGKFMELTNNFQRFHGTCDTGEFSRLHVELLKELSKM